MRRPRRKPFVFGIHGPIPPRHPRKRAGQMVWPRDKKLTSWGRLKDVFTGKGPDIWCSRRGSLGPHRPVWSNWRSRGNDPLPHWDNLGYLYTNEEPRQPWFGAGRPDNVKYDFKKRRYRIPDPQAWSDVKYDRNNRPIYYRTALFGDEIWENDHANPFMPDTNPFPYDQHYVVGWDWDEREFP